MPKNPNSRPDVQVLEDRVVRLKSQIEGYKGLRLYKATKQKLSSVCCDLEECIEILNDAIQGGSNFVGLTSISAFEDSPAESLPEFSVDSDSDLSDTLILYSTKPSESSSSPKNIVKSYAARMQQCADSIGCSSGIIQVNQFCQLLNSWYQIRFAPTPIRNPNFKFKATRICEWIDLLMAAAGNALHTGMFASFLSDIHAWLDLVKGDDEQVWPLPYSVMQLQKSGTDCYTREAILLERIVKPSLFDESFYADKLHTIETAYRAAFNTDDKELLTSSIIGSCPKLIVTSSFDSSKYDTEM